VYTLPSRENIEVKFQFSIPDDLDGTEDRQFESDLIIRFDPKGVEQRFPLRAHYIFPTLEVKPSKPRRNVDAPSDVLDFGMVHVAAPQKLLLTLTNPTKVAAAWSLDPESVKGVFTCVPISGAIPGKGVGLPKTQEVEVTFAPTSADVFARRLKFIVADGRGISLTVEGQGTVDETTESALDRPDPWNMIQGS